MDCELSSPIKFVKGVGPARANLLNKLGIYTVKDALLTQPIRYEYKPSLCKIKDIQLDKVQVVYGKILSAQILKPSKKNPNLSIFEIQLTDGTGWLKAVWFNQTYLKNILKPNTKVILTGKTKRGFQLLISQMDNPDFEIIEEDDEIVDNSIKEAILPVYNLTEGLTQRRMRAIIHFILSNCKFQLIDIIPQNILDRLKLPSLNDSIRAIHNPSNTLSLDDLNESKSKYHKRLIFEELFVLQLGLSAYKMLINLERGISMKGKGLLKEKILSLLPFKLTSAQQRVLSEIERDMALPRPMNRLVQGDVGCGKTIVALLAMVNAVECGYQAVLMAPTEILAEQHFLNIKRLVNEIDISLCLLTASTKNKALQKITKKDAMIIVGTHALIQEGVEFENLGLAVIDEQHRFGVLQRASLKKKGTNPDVLIMTATPIPRTLALTIYGDLDYSVIDTLPPGRPPVITRLFFEKNKHEIYKILEEEIKKGRQAYIVYPLIEESEKIDLRSAIEGAEKMAKRMPQIKVGLIHGRMKQYEREQIMKEFKDGEINILVSTTVIEVGVDVQNATVMIILHAERFGLAQLHQLRGRVGRGSHHSYCLLLCYGYSEDAEKRLKVMIKTNDGFKVAEEDMKIRGFGDFFGTRQSGMPELRSVNSIRDSHILELAKEEADNLITKDPQLKDYPLLKKTVQDFWGERLEVFKTA
ncbi:MAG TPA: ATP-dependent DNA helicase RecG [Nitrospirae bacterium]|nr:ATP-dependent DNA helicase RecG [Nitrospirota bacterium]